MRMTIEDLRALARRADTAIRVDVSYAIAMAEQANASGGTDEKREARKAAARAYWHTRQAKMSPEDLARMKAERSEAARARRKAARDAQSVDNTR